MSVRFEIETEVIREPVGRWQSGACRGWLRDENTGRVYEFYGATRASVKERAMSKGRQIRRGERSEYSFVCNGGVIGA